MTAIGLHPLSVGDLDWVCSSERDLHAFPWGRQHFEDSLAAGYSCCMLSADGRRAGYAVYMQVLDEAHLLNISVLESFQRQGLGQLFLDELTRRASSAGARVMFLEVRPSNLPAHRLYLRAGFSEVGRRKAYYSAIGGGKEDAIVMRREFEND